MSLLRYLVKLKILIAPVLPLNC